MTEQHQRPRYLLQIVEDVEPIMAVECLAQRRGLGKEDCGRARKVVRDWKAGNPIEIELVNELCNRLRTRHVGMLRTQEGVLAIVQQEFASLLWNLKSRV